MNKVTVRFAALLFAVLIISGISERGYADTLRAGNINGELSCDDLELETYAALPMTNIAISGIPEDYEGMVGAEILNGGDVTGMVLADQYSDGSWYLISPVNPEFSNEGTTVTLRMVDEDVTCDPFEFEIIEMPIDPLDLDEYMDNFEEVIELFAGHRGYTIDELIEMDEQTAETNLQAAIFMSKMVRGVDGYTDLRAMMSRENLGEDLNDDEWDMLMTLYGRAFSQPDTTTGVRVVPSEANSDIRGQSGFNLENQPDYTKWASAEIPGTSRPWEYGSEASSQLDYCSLMYPNHSAELLESYLKNYNEYDRMVRNLELTQNETRAIMIGLTIAGAVATGGTSAALGLATAGAGATFSITGFLLEFGRALYPHEVFDFYVENYGPDRFLEDDTDLAGGWEKAFISAKSESFDFGSEGMRAIWGTVGGFIMNKVPGGADAPARLASEAGKTLTSNTIGDMLGKMPGTQQIPACEMGPVDISDEKYSRFYALENDDVVEFTGHHEFEVIGTGQAELVVCALETLMRDVSGTPLCIDSHNLLVTVPRIDVRMVKTDRPNTRGIIRVAPGEILELEAMVQNANDETVSWSVDPPGQHGLTVYGNGEEATLVISDDEDHFPFMLTVESMSNTGLRADPNAPPREQTRVVDLVEVEEPEEFVDCRDNTPVRMQDLTPCTFIAYMEGPDIRRRGYPDFEADHCYAGTIRSMGLNEHGVFNMRWSGRHDGRLLSRVMFRIHPPENDQYTYETEGVYFGGGLEIDYETERRRSPISRETVMATAIAQNTFTTENRKITMYPLAGTNLWAGRFEAEVKTNPTSNARRDSGNQTFTGVFLIGEECMWPQPEDSED